MDQYFLDIQYVMQIPRHITICPRSISILYSILVHEMDHYFLDIQYVMKIPRHITICPFHIVKLLYKMGNYYFLDI